MGEQARRVLAEGKWDYDRQLLISNQVYNGSAGSIIVTPLVLGDNRGRSQDGRYFGTISEDLLVGRAVLRIWPPSRAGGI